MDIPNIVKSICFGWWMVGTGEVRERERERESSISTDDEDDYDSFYYSYVILKIFILIYLTLWWDPNSRNNSESGPGSDGKE